MSKPVKSLLARDLPGASAAGFTLLELMVVLVLIGIVFSFAMLSFGGDDIAELMDEETGKLQTLLSLAADEAVLRGEELAVHFSDEGYEFLVLRESAWQTPAGDALLKAYQLPPGVRMRLQLEGDPPVVPGVEQDPEAVTPQVFILSSGEITPFTAILESDESTAQFRLIVSLMGDIVTERGETL